MNVNYREWAVNGRKYSTTGDSALGEQASCLLFSLKQAGCLLSQCLERLKTTGQDGLLTRMYPDKNSVKTEAGLSVTTRRVVTPRPGLADPESGEFGKSVDAECCLRAVSENSKPKAVINGKNGQPKSGKVRLKGLKDLQTKPFSQFPSDYQRE